MRRPATKAKPAPTRAASPVRAPSRLPVWPIAVFLALVTIALYWPATGYDFVNYDDDMDVMNNTHVSSGLSLGNASWAFGSGHAANWHPVTWLSHMLDCQLFGLKPRGHHLTSVLLRGLNAGLVFVLLQLMTGAKWRSLAVAALFALHPLRVESVAWVSERKDVLSVFFGLLALIAYACYAQRRMQNAKDTDTHHAPRNTLHVPLPLLLEKFPFFVLAALGSIVTFLVQQGAGAMKGAQSLPLGMRIANALISYDRYLGKLFWPTDLAIYYPHPGHWPLATVVLAGGLIVGLSVLAWVQRRRHPYLLVGCLLFLGTLVPVIGLVQVGEQAMADRYTYLPSLGMLVLAVWGAYELTRPRPYQVLALSVAGGAASVLCLSLTRQQLGYWQDSESLFRHALQVTEDNQIAHKVLGAALDAKGRTDEAISQFQEALRLKPDSADALNNLGVALGKKGVAGDSIRQAQEAFTLKSGYSEARKNPNGVLPTEGNSPHQPGVSTNR